MSLEELVGQEFFSIQLCGSLPQELHGVLHNGLTVACNSIINRIKRKELNDILKHKRKCLYLFLKKKKE